MGEVWAHAWDTQEFVSFPKNGEIQGKSCPVGSRGSASQYSRFTLALPRPAGAFATCGSGVPEAD